MTSLAFAAMLAYVAILAMKVVLARRWISAHPETETRDTPITILQPILGGDPALGDALRTNLANAPRSARFLWLVDEDDAEGQRVTAAIDDARVTILRCAPPHDAENPKTAKLARALAHVATPYLAVLDDDTILSPAHLGRAIHALDSCTLYTGLPRYLPGANVWSSLVTQFVNDNAVQTYLALLPLLPPLSINGMFYAMKTEELRAIGGFAPIVTKLCDDYALAALVKRTGGTIRQGITPQFLRTTVRDARHYAALMHRWFLFANVLLRDQPATTQLLLFVFLGLPPLLFALSFLALAGGAIPMLALAGLLIARHAAIGMLAAPFDEKPRPIAAALLSVLSELLQPLHWLHATVRHTMRWRTRTIRLAHDGTFAFLPPVASGER
ncbi:MAG TPA: glycosyltransferase [Thermoanaerobaculia bacterium]|nr:glycosyltransferase [Thermoanaerobaculia bacterium]